jgi:hypothetical protein
MAGLKRFDAIGIFLMFTFTGALVAQRWEFLGESHVDGAQDHDKIKVTAAKGTFRALQFKVRDGAVEFDRVLVHFGNHTTEQISIRYKVPAGGQTRVLDLPGERRVIENIEFWYSRGNWNSDRKPTVQAFGLR